MEITRNRYLILIAVMSVASVMANYLSYGTYDSADAGIQAIQKIPLDIGKWRGKDLPLEDQIYEILETRSIIQRTYHATDAQEVLLSIVHYPETKVDFHAPEACLGGRGIQIQKQPKSINIVCSGKQITIDLNQLLWKQDNQEKLVYYFYKAGGFMGSAYIKLRLSLAANKFTGNPKSGSLIRVSTPIETTGGTEQASDVLNDFLNQLYPFLITYL
jgi:EpsI family protein